MVDWIRRVAGILRWPLSDGSPAATRLAPLGCTRLALVGAGRDSPARSDGAAGDRLPDADEVGVAVMTEERQRC